jgi:hypothetical protein
MFKESKFDSENKKPKDRIEEIKEIIFDHDIPDEYQSLAEKVKLIEQGTAYSEGLYEQFYAKTEAGKKCLSELGDFASRKMYDEIVVDLGCGSNHFMNLFSTKYCRLYVGIDFYPSTAIPIVKMVKTPHRARSYMGKNKEASMAVVGEDSHRPPSYLMSSRAESAVFTSEDKTEIDKKVFLSTFPKYRLVENSDGKVFEISDDMLKALSRFKSDSVGVVMINGIEAAEYDEQTKNYLTALEKEVERVLKVGGVFINYNSDIGRGNLAYVNIKNSLEINVGQKTDKEDKII